MVIRSRSVLLFNGVFQHEHDLFWLTSCVRAHSFDVLITFDEIRQTTLAGSDDNYAICLNKLFRLVIRVLANEIFVYEQGKRVTPPEDCFGDVYGVIPVELREGCIMYREDALVLAGIRKRRTQEVIVVTRWEAQDIDAPFYSKDIRHYLETSQKHHVFIINNHSLGMTEIRASRCISAGKYEQHVAMALYIAGESISCCQMCFKQL